jgi:hypothetical protein
MRVIIFYYNLNMGRNMGDLSPEPALQIPEMLQGGESQMQYKERVGALSIMYPEALADFRHRLAAEKGISEDELHEGILMHSEDSADLISH